MNFILFVPNSIISVSLHNFIVYNIVFDDSAHDHSDGVFSTNKDNNSNNENKNTFLLVYS